MKEIATPWPQVLVLSWTADGPPAAWFDEDEIATATSFRLPKRRDEWLLSRAAAKRLAVRLGLAPGPRACSVSERRLHVDGRPTAWNVSISHSLPYCGASISREPVGLDVQQVRPFEDEAAHLFLSDAEIAAMRGCAIAERLLHFWCAKEAAFKRWSPRYATMKQVPLALLGETRSALRFDDAATVAIDDLIVAVSGGERTTENPE